MTVRQQRLLPSIALAALLSACALSGTKKSDEQARLDTQEAKTSTPDSAPKPQPQPQPLDAASSDHCDVLAETLAKAKLECLPVPGLYVAGIYGPKADPNQNTLEAGFGTPIPDGVIGKERPGGSITRSFTQRKTLSVSGGASLRQFFSWLPNLDLSVSREDTVVVDVSLGNLRLQPVQNLADAIGPIVNTVNTDARTLRVRNMLNRLCKPDTVVSAMVLSAMPKVSIHTVKGTSITGTAGWPKVAGFEVTKDDSASGKVELTSSEPIVFAAELTESEPRVHELCQLPICGSEGATCCPGSPSCAADLTCTQQRCVRPPPPPPVTLTAAQITWRTTGDNKDWNTQPVVDVVDGNGRTVAHIDCCSADRNSDEWNRGREATRNLTIRVSGVTKSELKRGRFTAMRNPVGNDDWDYTAIVKLIFSDGDTATYSCSGRNSCDANW